MRSNGYRRGTRHRFSQAFRKHGMPKPSILTRVFKKGQYVDVVVNPAIHKGMPHKFFHGRTGKIFNIDKRSIGILMNKRCGPRYVEKMVIARVEHVRPSRCNEEYIKRRTENDRLRREAAARGEKLGSLKRKPGGPRGAVLISTENNTPIEIRNEPYFEVY
uniref:eL21 n=1 Tax=Paranosema locustae TaxID=235221 RepID=UPI00187D6DF2|nr:Chain LT0, eL21 [Paranosema locustae]|eukprot:jgi/Antlo1/2268/1414